MERQPFEIGIRPALRSEADFLVPLVNRAGEGIPLCIWKQMAAPDEDPWNVGRARIESEETQVSYRHAWIAEFQGKRTGCLVLRTLPREPESLQDLPSLFVPLQQLENEALGSCYVYVLSVVPEMRSLGIGARLLGFAEGFRTDRGMSLIVADNNVRAKSLYERCGYREAARRPMCKEGWESEGQDWILMTKS